jgi:hypothetical protein
MKKAIAFYSIFLGVAVIGLWTLILAGGPLPEGRIELGFHLYAEFAMAVICLVSGVMLLRGKPFAVETSMGGLGMVTYSVVNAAGYYGQKGETGIMVMFILLSCLTVLAICGHYSNLKHS